MANKRSLNRVILVGNVGKDPEITHIPSLDKDVAKFSLATTEVFMDRNTNQFQDYTEWHNIVAWGWAAKKVERGVSKGSLVLVEGKLKTRKWKDQNDQERRTTEIRADSVTVLESRADRGDREAPYEGGRGAGFQDADYGGPGGPPMGKNDFSQPGPPTSTQQQAPPEMQIDEFDDINNIPYDDSDPF
ncbi:MAG: single-stranded DNA-binding protein [Candidatus Aminicenantes bacterium]|nr:single-stranded DNA-binding protein [Candidatus Aminicenantes bacterium]NIM82464.1 single-stranded DNA-binding protein [Candidatus Aminicenantes bacterium]NIN21825.1 single-stranded DNA-binding protein [Candidatus Aminicenantes bacterium]NIN45617.1 single-stranded DNA-binding protein [Candidatus Aminicenantes bacterium]NIN88448.1 single-stranded DNA-binding protein [Candidatus Aminicenantes bacterium]